MALSQSLRCLLPFEVLAKENIKRIGINTKKLKLVTQSSVFENNYGAIVVASSPRLTPTGKFITVKYHFFGSHIESDRNGSKPISIKITDGKINPAVIFFKSNSKYSESLDLRNLLCGR